MQKGPREFYLITVTRGTAPQLTIIAIIVICQFAPRSAVVARACREAVFREYAFSSQRNQHQFPRVNRLPDVGGTARANMAAPRPTGHLPATNASRRRGVEITLGKLAGSARAPIGSFPALPPLSLVTFFFFFFHEKSEARARW